MPLGRSLIGQSYPAKMGDDKNMIMVKYIVKRLLMVIPVVLGVMVIVFFF